MDNIELYINGALCDTGKNLGVRLRLQLITPAELNTKNSQASYSITLPPSKTNEKIFHYASVEETKGKFTRTYAAELIINSCRVFQGNFRISEIGKDGYKGNLLVPTPKTIKDVFGETKLNENTPLMIQFEEFADSINKWNSRAREDSTEYTNFFYDDINDSKRTIKNAKSPCMFPYVLYGLLPKSANSVGNYSSAEIWDDTVRLGIEDFPPSINVLEMLKHIFASRDYELTGTALTDTTLRNLYMNYKNAPDYEQPWSWGSLVDMKLKGKWKNVDWAQKGHEPEINCYMNDTFYTVDLFNSLRANNKVITDAGVNVVQSALKNSKGMPYQGTQIAIPTSGYYKVRLRGKLNIPIGSPISRQFEYGFQIIGGENGKKDNHNNSLDRRRFELKLIRDFGEREFDLSNARINRTYFADNVNQSKESIPLYFPKRVDVGYKKYKELMFIDPAENPKLVLGLCWGKKWEDRNLDSESGALDLSHGTVLVAKSGYSWDVKVNKEKTSRVVIPSEGYRTFDYPLKEEDENENEEEKEEGEQEEGNEEEEKDTSVPPEWRDSKRFKIELKNAPISYANIINRHWQGDGEVNAIVWFDKGELITLAITSDQGEWGKSYHKGWINQEVEYELDIMPFRIDKDWAKIDSAGNGREMMNWSDPINFAKDTIDLVKFLPADVRTDDFIENFCKAFNLNLSQSGKDAFSLNVKQKKIAQQTAIIDLDNAVDIRSCSNQPLGLPSAYSIGFSANEDEEGFQNPGEYKDDGAGMFYTGATDGKITEQKSNFSYNWFKKIKKIEGTEKVDLELPIISKAEVWIDSKSDYPKAMQKRYTDLAQRFWYYDGLLDAKAKFKIGENFISLAKVSNKLPGKSILSYKDEKNTILRNYFSLLTDASSHYTIVECYITPQQYEQIGKGARARLNGDIYYVAEVDGYDPLNKEKCTLKLIRQVVANS